MTTQGKVGTRRRGIAALAVIAAVATMVSSLAVPAQADPIDTFTPGACIRNDGIGAEPFSDVVGSDWWADAVAWAFANGIVTGKGEGTYQPTASITRGEFATIMWRTVCSPAADTDVPFTDLRIGAFYLAAVEWLWENGLTTGVAPDRFDPEGLLTRGELATFLHRLVGEPVVASAGFDDVDPGDFFAAAVDWLIARGLTTGSAPDLYSPERPLTRAEVVVFLHRLHTIGDVPASFVTVADGFSQPVALEQHPTTGAWFIAEKGGDLVRLTAFTRSDVLDLAVSGGSEQGLLGVAIPDDGAHLYVSYTASGDSIVAEYELDGDVLDAGSRREVLRVDQPASNHNGGDLAFGPDGYLYFSLGDGGGSNDTFGHGQNTSTPLGAILRIDPGGTGGAFGDYGIPADNPFVGSTGLDEIWAYGLRNPWRISFDIDTGDLWVGDVGQNAREEINRLAGPAFGIGANLEWPLREGSIATPGVGGARPPLGVGPVHEYGLSGSQSITGGHVYRGSAIAALEGTYLWADFYRGQLMGWRDTIGVESEEIVAVGGQPTAFGQDTDGEVYVVTIGGEFRKLVPNR